MLMLIEQLSVHPILFWGSCIFILKCVAWVTGKVKTSSYYTDFVEGYRLLKEDRLVKTESIG